VPEQLAAEQAALRRVATLVARGVPPEEVFAAVTEQAGGLLAVRHASLGRYEPDGAFTVVAWSGTGDLGVRVGSRLILGGNNVSTLVFETGRAARIDSYADASGPVGVAAREDGVGSGVGTPVIVEGRLWGVMAAYSRAGRPLPTDTEARLASFTELVATAIANAESRTELIARGRGSSPPPMRRAGGSSAICTTASSSGSFRSGWSCARRRRSCRCGPASSKTCCRE
jgi:GAF domain-containing protein